MAVDLDAALAERVRDNLSAFERRAMPEAGRHLAAVALVIGADDAAEPCFVLTRRASRLRAHAGQWALPGGRRDPGEGSIEAALRETREEVGLELGQGAVVGLLDDFATRSGYVITPVVVWHGARLELEANLDEVAAAYRVPVQDLAAPPNLRTIPESDRPVISLDLPSVDSNVHAPTAAILHQLWEVAFAGRATRVAHFEQPVFAWK